MKPRNRRMHKLTSGIGLVIAITLLASGCSVTGAGTVSGADGGQSGTINTLFMKQAGYSETQINEMISSFEKKYPKIRVKPTYVAYEALHDKIVTSAPASTYDVVLADVIWPAEFASKGLVTDLTSKIPASWKTEMLGGALSTAEYQKKYYGVPWGPSSKMFFYNKAMLAKVGATADDITTWAGVLEVAKKLKSAGVVNYPLSWSWAQAEALICDYAQILGAFGGSFTSPDGKLSVNDAKGVEALTWMRKTITDGLTDPASLTFLENDTDKSMASGKTAMEINWESTLADLNDPKISSIVGDGAVAVTPSGPTGLNPGVNGSMALSVPTGSKHQGAAWTFIKYVTSQAVQEKYTTGWLPNWKASYQNPKITTVNPAIFAVGATQYDSFIERPQVTDYNTVSQILQVQLQKALLGDVTPQQALDAAVSQAKSAKG